MLRLLRRAIRHNAGGGECRQLSSMPRGSGRQLAAPAALPGWVTARVLADGLASWLFCLDVKVICHSGTNQAHRLQPVYPQTVGTQPAVAPVDPLANPMLLNDLFCSLMSLCRRHGSPAQRSGGMAGAGAAAAVPALAPGTAAALAAAAGQDTPGLSAENACVICMADMRRTLCVPCGSQSEGATASRG